MRDEITLRNVSKRFGSHLALDDVSLQIPAGIATVLVGENGAGKTTLIRTLLGLSQPDSGTIELFGKHVRSSGQHLRDRIGFVHESNCLYENLSVRELEAVCRRAYSRWDSQRFNLLVFQRFSLPKDKRVKQLSKGMQTRLSVAVALSHEAELFVLDEPTSGLDPIVRNELYGLLRVELQKENRTMLISTHITSDVESIADQIVIIDKGQIVHSLATETLREQYAICTLPSGTLEPGDYDQFIGYRESTYSFEGLTDETASLKARYPQLQTRRPTIEELLLYTHKEEIR